MTTGETPMPATYNYKQFASWADKVQLEANLWCEFVDWEDIEFPWAERYLAQEPVETTARDLIRAARDSINRIDAALKKAGG